MRPLRSLGMRHSSSIWTMAEGEPCSASFHLAMQCSEPRRSKLVPHVPPLYTSKANPKPWKLGDPSSKVNMYVVSEGHISADNVCTAEGWVWKSACEDPWCRRKHCCSVQVQKLLHKLFSSSKIRQIMDQKFSWKLLLKRVSRAEFDSFINWAVTAAFQGCWVCIESRPHYSTRTETGGSELCSKA